MDEIEIKTIKKIQKSILNSHTFDKYHRLKAELKELDERRLKLKKEVERVLDELKEAGGL